MKCFFRVCLVCCKLFCWRLFLYVWIICLLKLFVCSFMMVCCNFCEDCCFNRLGGSFYEVDLVKIFVIWLWICFFCLYVRCCFSLVLMVFFKFLMDLKLLNWLSVLLLRLILLICLMLSILNLILILLLVIDLFLFLDEIFIFVVFLLLDEVLIINFLKFLMSVLGKFNCFFM